MTLLSEYESKKSWQNTLPVVNVYKSKTTGYRDIDFAAVMRQEAKLTLDVKSETGFKEIDTDSIYASIPDKWQKLVVLPPRQAGQFSREETVKILIQGLKEYLLANWDSKKPHLVLVSGGLDSRLLTYILRDIREEYGNEWLGDIHFRFCKELHDKGAVYDELMKKQGWKLEQYSTFKARRMCDADYYNYGWFDFNPNSFAPIQLNWFFDDKITFENARGWALVTGSYGGELFDYPIRFRKAGFFQDRWKAYMHFLNYCIENQSRIFYHFGDVLRPYIGYEYLAEALRIPDEYYKFGVKGKQRADYMRSLMLDQFDDDIRFTVGHQFDFSLSEKRKEYIRNKWEASKFYRDFKHESDVTEAEPWIANRENVDSKLYSLAGVYERV